MRYRLSYKRRVSDAWQEIDATGYAEARRLKARYRAQGYAVALHWWSETEQRWIGA